MNFLNLQMSDKLLYIIVAIYLLFLAYSEALKNISVYLMFGYLLFQLFSRNITLTIDIVNVSILAHLTVVIIGIWVGVNSQESLNQFVDVAKIVWVFLFFREINLRFLTYEKILQLLIIGFIIAITEAMIQYFFLGVARIELHSVGSPNRSAVYIMYILVASLCLMPKYNNNTSKFLIPFCFLIASISIIIGGSRMAVYSLPLILIYYFLFYKNKSIQKVILIVIALILLICSLVYFYPDLFLSQKLSLGFNDKHRIQIWLSSIYIWLEHNLWFGIGVGNSIFFSVSDYFTPAFTLDINNTHNVYLDMLLERGILGFTTFLIFIYSLFFYKSSYDLKLKPLLPLVVFSLLLLGLANITFRYEFALLFVTIIGAYLNPSIEK